VPSEPVVLVDVAELRGEADEARCLAALFQDPETISDLLSYAAALDADANRCGNAVRHPEDALMAENFSGSMWPNALIGVR